MSEEFKQFISTLEYKDGQIISQGQRLGIIDVSWLVGIQQEMENTMGADGAFAIFDRAGEESAVAYGQFIAQQLGHLPLDEQLKTIFGGFALRGFGIHTITEFKTDPLLLKYSVKNSMIAGIIKGSAAPKCYLQSSMVTITNALIKAKGLTEKEIVWEESQCVAKGDPCCEYTFKEREE